MLNSLIKGRLVFMAKNMRLQTRFALPISLAFILLIPNIVFAQQTNVTVSGYVLDNNGAPVENAWVSFHDPVNNIGMGNYTLSDGYYTILLPTGTYNLEVFPQEDNSLNSFFKQNIVVTGNMQYDVILVLRAEILDTQVSPQSIAQGETGNAQFSVRTEDGITVTGLVDADFEIWLHDWSDPNGSEWWLDKFNRDWITYQLNLSKINPTFTAHS